MVWYTVLEKRITTDITTKDVQSMTQGVKMIQRIHRLTELCEYDPKSYDLSFIKKKGITEVALERSSLDKTWTNPGEHLLTIVDEGNGIDVHDFTDNTEFRLGYTQAYELYKLLEHYHELTDVTFGKEEKTLVYEDETDEEETE